MVVNTLHWTTRDLDALPDDGGWKRYEIIAGDLYVTRAPHIRHQSVVVKLCVRLERWSEETGLGSTFDSPGIIFSDVDAVIPDLIWISGDRLATGINDSGHLTVAPELVIEVLSPGDRNEQRDKEIKLKLYSIHGVQEYWIVSWQLKTLEIYRRSHTQLQLDCTLGTADTLTSPLLPGFSTPVAEIFPYH